MNKQILFILFLALLAITPLQAQSLNFELTGSYSDLGTDEMISIEVDGVTIHFPPDQLDVVDLAMREFKAFFEVRKEAAAKEADWLLKMSESDEFERARARIPQVIATDGASESFDETLAGVKNDVKLLSENWKQWSGEVGEIHLWNRHRVKDFSQGQGLRFPEMFYQKREGIYSRVGFSPPFSSERMVGLDYYRLKQGAVSPMRIDIPIPGDPGMSAIEVSERLTDLLVDFTKAMIEGFPNFARRLVPFAAEKLILAEIEAGYFDANARQRPEVLLRALARLHFFLLENRGKTSDERWQVALKLSRLELPDDRHEALAFLDELEGIDIFDLELKAKYRQAASRFVFMGMLMAAQDSDSKKPIFHVLKDLGEPIPDGGYDQAGFLKVARRIYPTLDRHVETARDKSLEAARVWIEQHFSEERVSSEEAEDADRESDLPEDYQTKQFGEYTLTFPDELSEAVAKIGDDWMTELSKAQQSLIQKHKGKDIVNPIEVTREDLFSLESYGLEIDSKWVKSWRHSVAMSMNSGRMFWNCFVGKRIAIWTKEDIKAVIAEGGYIENISYDFERDVGNVSFGILVQGSDLPENFTASDLQSAFASAKPPELIVVLKKEDIEGRSVDEQIAQIRSDKQLVEAIISTGSKLAPESFLAMMGVSEFIDSEPHGFFLIVHEVVEAALIHTTIASRDRRWFCDGLANAIAIRDCDRRFGKGVGRKLFESLYDPEKLEPMIDQVDLLAWAAGENERKDVDQEEGVSNAHYYFATKAILAALEGKDVEFIAAWIAKIRETNWERTNAKTVISAYNEVSTGGDLKKILSENSGL